METFFMNSKNSKANEPNRFKYALIDKLDLKNPNKNMALGNFSFFKNGEYRIFRNRSMVYGSKQ